MDEAVAYALGNAIRNEALAILAEGKRSTSELAKIMNVDVKRLGNHIRRLYEANEDLWLLWDAIPLDAQGRKELAEHFARFLRDRKGHSGKIS
jgi:hypothetical protein